MLGLFVLQNADRLRLHIWRVATKISHALTLLNTDVQNCHITLEFITIRLRVRHPSVERPPYSEKGTAAQVPKEEQCPRTNNS